MSAGARIKARLNRWNPEVGMRYMPVLREVRRTLGRPTLVDVGSGPSGAALYWRGKVVGVDLDGASGSDNHLPVVGSILDLPIGDRSAAVVLCLDVLEHVAPADRLRAVDELVRVTGAVLYLAVPAGDAASAHDAAMARVFEQHRGHVDRFFTEHLENGLPGEGELLEMVSTALVRQGREAAVRPTWNSPLNVRRRLMTMYARRSRLDSIAWVGFLLSLPVLSRVRGRPAYRLIVRVDLRSPLRALNPELLVAEGF